MRAFVRVGLLAVWIGLAWGSWAWAQQAPITGTVVQLWWAKDDLFVQLDTNNDTRADLLVKIEHKTQIVDVNNKPLPLSAIVVGVTLTVTHYKWDDAGYYEAYRVVVGAASPGQSPPAQQPIKGTVLQTFKFGMTSSSPWTSTATTNRTYESRSRAARSSPTPRETACPSTRSSRA
jgi:hypothetical protein